MLIDDRLASSLWPGQPAVGQRLLLGAATAPREWAEVVGVVEHLQLHDVRGSDQRPQIWSTYSARPSYSLSVVAAARRAIRALAGSIKRGDRAAWPEAAGHRRATAGRLTSPRRPRTRGSRSSCSHVFALTGRRPDGHWCLWSGRVCHSAADARDCRPARARRRRRRDRGTGAARRRRLDGGGHRRGSRRRVRADALPRPTLLFNVGTRDPLTFAAVALLLAIVALVATALPAIRAVGVGSDARFAIRVKRA